MRLFRFCFFSLLLIASGAKGQISINEICPANADIVYDTTYYNFSGWVELHNSSSTDVDIAGYYLSNDPADPDKWSFPEGSVIRAHDYLLVWCDEANDDLHTNFSLREKGGSLLLTDSLGREVQRIDFPAQYTNTSYGLTENGWGYMVKPTPLHANSMAVSGQRSGKVTASLAPGRYGASVAVSLAAGERGAIRYTTDGSDPGPDAMPYQGPILLERTATIKARAYADDRIPGPVAVFTYFIDEHPFSIPVISLTTNPDYLWDDRIGIYTNGTNGTSGPCFAPPVNWNQDWERHAYLELFSPGGIRLFGQDTDLRLSGGCSRNWPQKPFALKARNKYGDNEFEYPFFSYKGNGEYGGLFIRNSGNDQPLTMFRDALLQSLVVGQLDVDYQAYQPAALYLNGEYWGIQNLREKVDADYITSNYGFDSDDIDMLELNGSVIEGSADFYNAYLGGLEIRNLTDTAAFEYIDQHIDVQEYINYMVTQVYYANLDWPGNNIKYWRQRSGGGKFRWILHDLDFGFDLNKSTPSAASHPTLEFVTDPDNETWPNPAWSTFHFRKLLENPVFRARFIQTMSAAIAVTFSPERVVRHIDSLQSIVYQEMYYHRSRWGGTMDEWRKEVQLLRNFAVERNEYMRQHLREFFQLSPEVDVSVKVTPSATGTCKWNDVTAVDQVSLRPYASGTGYTLEAASIQGYRFKEWKITTAESIESPLVGKGSAWRYFDKGYAPDSGWMQSAEVPGAWKQGFGEFGYGDDDELTVVEFGPNPDDKHITTYFRTSFFVENTGDVSHLKALTKFDDGIVVYLNGNEVLRKNMPEGDVGYATLASGIRYGEEIWRDFRIDKTPLRNGVNIIAVEVHQVTPQSSDISFAMELKAVRLHNEVTERTSAPGLSGVISTNTHFEAIFEPTEDRRLVVNELSATKMPWVTDNFGEAEDWIEVYNPTDQSIDLDGFYITDDLSRKDKFRLQGDDLTIEAGGYLVLWADEEESQGSRHLNFKLSAEGEQVGLYEARSGELITHDEVNFERQFDNHSLARIPDGHASLAATARPTPGTSNILDTGSELEVLIYPNPFESYLHIESKSVIDWVIIYDFSAKIISQFKPENPRMMNLYQLPPGMYIFELISGPESGQYKVIKY